MIFIYQGSLYNHFPLPGEGAAELVAAYPGAVVLTPEEEAQFQSVKLPSAENPLNVNTANRFELMTLSLTLSLADQVIGLRPFANYNEFRAKTNRLGIDVDPTLITFDRVKQTGNVKVEVLNKI